MHLFIHYTHNECTVIYVYLWTSLRMTCLHYRNSQLCAIVKLFCWAHNYELWEIHVPALSTCASSVLKVSLYSIWVLNRMKRLVYITCSQWTNQQKATPPCMVNELCTGRGIQKNDIFQNSIYSMEGQSTKQYSKLRKKVQKRQVCDYNHPANNRLLNAISNNNNSLQRWI